MSYIELHTDSRYSDTLSFFGPEELVAACNRFGCDAVAITDRNSVQAYLSAEAEAQKRGIRLIYGVTIDCLDNDDRYAVTLLAKTETGRNNIFALIRLLNKNMDSIGRCVTRGQLENHCTGLLIGATAESGQLRRGILLRKSASYLKKAAKFYDYIEVAPEPYDVSSRLCSLAQQCSIPLCAVQNARLRDETDAAQYHAYCAVAHYWGQQEKPTPYRSPDELKELFEETYILPHEVPAIKQAFAAGMQFILSQIEEMPPLREHFCRGAEFRHHAAMAELKKEAVHQLRVQYGKTPHPEVKARFERELAFIDETESAETIILLAKIHDILRLHDYPLFLCGTWNSLFLLHLLGITEHNPLPGSVCEGGVGLTPVSTFAKGRTLLDLEIRVPTEALVLVREELVKTYQQRLLAVCYSDRTTETDDLPMEIIRQYMGEVCPDEAKNQLQENGLFWMSVAHAAHNIPERCLVSCLCLLPDETRWEQLPITKFTAPNMLEMDSAGFRIDLPHVRIYASRSLDAILECQRLSGFRWSAIPNDSPEVLNALKDAPEDDAVSAAFTVTGHQFSEFFEGVFEAIRPTDLNSLCRAVSLSHGTDIWLGNQLPQFRTGEVRADQLITCREDVYRYLTNRGAPESDAIRLMEVVRKGLIPGRGMTPVEAEILEHSNADAWFVDFCKRAAYLFPEAHSFGLAEQLVKLIWYALHGPDTVREFLMRTADSMEQYMGYT